MPRVLPKPPTPGEEPTKLALHVYAPSLHPAGRPPQSPSCGSGAEGMQALTLPFAGMQGAMAAVTMSPTSTKLVPGLGQKQQSRKQ